MSQQSVHPGARASRLDTRWPTTKARGFCLPFGSAARMILSRAPGIEGSAGGLRIVARRPVLAFMVIGVGAYLATVAIPPIVNAQVLPFDLPLHGLLGGALGVGIGVFLVTAALAGRDGVVDLARRSGGASSCAGI